MWNFFAKRRIGANNIPVYPFFARSGVSHLRAKINKFRGYVAFMQAKIEFSLHN